VNAAIDSGESLALVGERSFEVLHEGERYRLKLGDVEHKPTGVLAPASLVRITEANGTKVVSLLERRSA